MEKEVRPHCHVCMKEMKMGQKVVMDGTLNGILHAECSYLLPREVVDQGMFEDVIRRNQRWLKQFSHLIINQ